MGIWEHLGVTHRVTDGAIWSWFAMSCVPGLSPAGRWGKIWEISLSLVNLFRKKKGLSSHLLSWVFTSDKGGLTCLHQPASSPPSHFPLLFLSSYLRTSILPHFPHYSLISSFPLISILPSPPFSPLYSFHLSCSLPFRSSLALSCILQSWKFAMNQKKILGSSGIYWPIHVCPQ